MKEMIDQIDIKEYMKGMSDEIDKKEYMKGMQINKKNTWKKWLIK